MQIFNEPLTGGTRGGFDSQVGTGAEAPSFLGSVFTAAIPVTDTTGCYVEEATDIIDDTRSIVVKFQFRVPTSIQIGGSSPRALNIGSFMDNTQFALRFYLRADASSNIDSLSAVYQLAAGGAADAVIAPVSILPDTWYTFELTYIAARQTSAYWDGYTRIRIDDVTPSVLRDAGTGDLAGQFIGRHLVDSVRIGNTGSASSNSVDRTVEIRNVVMSPTDTHSATPETFYVDPETGDDANSATDNSPVRSASLLARHLQAGETLVLKNKTGYPHRMHTLMDGNFSTVYSGTASAPINITNDTGVTDHTPVLCSAKVGGDSPLQWAASDVAGAYYVVRGSDGDPGFGALYTALSGSGEPCIRIGDSNTAFEDYATLYAENKAASVAAIAEGEWAWGDGTNETPALGFPTLYYRPSGSIAGVIAEIVAAHNSLLDNIQGATSDYVTIEHLKVRGASHGITANGDGCLITQNDCGYGLIAGVTINGDSIARHNEVHHNQNRELSATKSNPENGGGVLYSGAGVPRIEGNYIHDNGDDGIEFDGTGEAVAVGNLVLNCGFNSPDGMGIETGTKAVSYKLYNNTILGCVKGIQCKTTAASVLRGNACFNNGSTFNIDIPTGASAVGSHNATGNVNIIGTYTEDAAGTDILFTGDYTSVLSAEGTPVEGSILVGAGTRWWGTSASPVGRDGEPFSDIDTDIGAIQTKQGPFHPRNL